MGIKFYDGEEKYVQTGFKICKKHSEKPYGRYMRVFHRRFEAFDQELPPYVRLDDGRYVQITGRIDSTMSVRRRMQFLRVMITSHRINVSPGFD